MSKENMNDENAPLRFVLRRKEVPVEMEMEDGTVKSYTLREMEGRDRDAYLNSMGDRMKFSNNGKVIGLKSFDGHQGKLLTRCLYDEHGELVALKDCQSFPTSVLDALFKRAEKLNALDVKSEEDEKND